MSNGFISDETKGLLFRRAAVLLFWQAAAQATCGGRDDGASSSASDDASSPASGSAGDAWEKSQHRQQLQRAPWPRLLIQPSQQVHPKTGERNLACVWLGEWSGMGRTHF